jgi:hypothetical protein
MAMHEPPEGRMTQCNAVGDLFERGKHALLRMTSMAKHWLRLDTRNFMDTVYMVE